MNFFLTSHNFIAVRIPLPQPVSLTLSSLSPSTEVETMSRTVVGTSRSSRDGVLPSRDGVFNDPSLEDSSSLESSG